MGPKLVIPDCDYGVSFTGGKNLINNADTTQILRVFEEQKNLGHSILRINLETNIFHVGLAPQYTIRDLIEGLTEVDPDLSTVLTAPFPKLRVPRFLCFILVTTPAFLVSCKMLKTMSPIELNASRAYLISSRCVIELLSNVETFNLHYPDYSPVFNVISADTLFCTTCLSIYLAENQHDKACRFHPGKITADVKIKYQHSDPFGSSSEVTANGYSCCRKRETDPGCTFSAHVPLSILSLYWEKLKHFLLLDGDEVQLPQEVKLLICTFLYRELLSANQAVELPHPTFEAVPSLFDRIVEQLSWQSREKELPDKPAREESFGDAFERKVNEVSSSLNQLFSEIGDKFKSNRD